MEVRAAVVRVLSSFSSQAEKSQCRKQSVRKRSLSGVWYTHEAAATLWRGVAWCSMRSHNYRFDEALFSLCKLIQSKPILTRLAQGVVWHISKCHSKPFPSHHMPIIAGFKLDFWPIEKVLKLKSLFWTRSIRFVSWTDAFFLQSILLVI